jgi:hypothetical protein
MVQITYAASRPGWAGDPGTHFVFRDEAGSRLLLAFPGTATLKKIAYGAALIAVAAFVAGCSGSSRTLPAAESGPGSRGIAAVSGAAVTATPKFHKMAPLRMVNDPPARFEYAYEAEIACLTGPPDPDIDNDNDIDTVPPNKRGPIVSPQRDRTLPVGEFTLATHCAGETPTPAPTPTPVPTPTIQPRSVARSAASAVRGTSALVVPVTSPTPTPAATPGPVNTPAPGMVRSFYVIQIDLADRKNPVVVSGPAAVAYDALNFAAAAAPMQLTAGHRYIFDLAYQDTAATPSPTPSPTDTPTPVPTDTPSPGPSPTITPCPGAIAIINQGTYCYWSVPHPPADIVNSNPNLIYSAPAGYIGFFDVRSDSARELATNGTAYSLTGGHENNISGIYVGIDSPASNLGFTDGVVMHLDFFAPPPAVPASPHNIAGDACFLTLCSDVAVANGDVYFYNPTSQTIDQDFPLTSPAATASMIVRTNNSGPFDILALTPDRHIVYASMDDHGVGFTEHLLPDVMPAGYRFTGAARIGNALHFTASDYVLGANPRGHGFHTSIDLTTFASHNVPFDFSGATCDAAGISSGPSDGTYFIPCVIETREFNSVTDAMVHDLPVEADGAVTRQIGVNGQPDVFFTSYRDSSVIELQWGVFYPGVRQQAKMRTPTSKH